MPAHLPVATTIELSGRTVDLETGRVDGGRELRPLELDLLRYLAARPEQVVSHEELLTHVWGYSPRSRTRTLYTTWHRLRVALEPDPTAPRHLRTVPGQGLSLVGLGPERRTNLVVPGRPLIGRGRELDVLRDAAPGLLTIVGPGGVGKTRLALAHAWQTASDANAWFCDTASATSAAEVAERVAATIGAVLENARAELGAVMAARRIHLLVIDDADEVDDLGPTLAEWCREAPDTRFLVTRRHPLGIDGEHRLLLRPLGVPSGPDRLDGEAADLLVRAIRTADAAFDPRGCESVLNELVVRLDGLPLALEIVAPQIAALGPEPVLDAVRAGHALEDTHDASLPGRGSLRAILDWTFARLPEESCSTLRQLAAFTRSFSLALADAVVARDPIEPTLHRLVTDLVERGLVYRVAESRRPRFALLATVKIGLGPSDPGAVRRHAEACLSLAREHFVRAGGLLDEFPLDLDEADEALAAARYALRSPEDRRWAELLDFAVRAGTDAGRHSAVAELVRDALGLPLSARSRVRLSAWQAQERVHIGHDDAARAYEEVVSSALAADLPEVAAASEARHGALLFNLGRKAAAAAAVLRAEAYAREVRDPSPRLLAYVAGRVAHVRICLEPAVVAHREQALDRLARADRPVALAIARGNVVQCLLSERRIEEALRLAERGVREVGERNTSERATLLVHASCALRYAGRQEEALGRVDEALELVARDHLKRHGPVVSLERARVLHELGRTEEALAEVEQGCRRSREIRHRRLEACSAALAAHLSRHLGTEDHVARLWASWNELVAMSLWVTAESIVLDLVEASIEGRIDLDPLALSSRLLSEDLGPRHPNVAELHAELLRRVGSRDPARDVLVRAEQAFPNHPQRPVLRLARAALAAESGERGEAELGLGATERRADQWSGLYRARCALVLGRRAEALAEADRFPPHPRETLRREGLDEIRRSVGEL